MLNSDRNQNNKIPKFCIEKDCLEVIEGRYKGCTGYYSNYDSEDKTYLFYFPPRPKKAKKIMKNIKVINEYIELEPVWIKEKYLKSLGNI